MVGGMVGGMHSMVERGMGALSRMKTGIENMPGRFSGAVRSGLNNMKSQYRAGMASTIPPKPPEPYTGPTVLQLHPTQNNAARGARGELDHMSQTELSKLRGGPAAPTPGPSSPSNAAITPEGGGLAGASPLAMAAGMAAVGGVTSYATGGNFGQGALLGAAGGYGMMKAGMAGSALKGSQLKGSFLGKEMGGNLAKMTKGARTAGREFFGDTGNRRAAMLAGAGLSGMVFGGNRRSHKRGFNSRRGNGF